MSRIRLRAAWRAMQQLLRDPEQTGLVFEIGEALAGRQPERLLARVRRDPAGARLFAERPVFDPGTCDLERLAALPDGSFGRVFADWMIENRFTPGLMERESRAADPDLAYLGRRLTQVHDFWHVLTGYNRDPIGELGVLGFTYAQTRSPGIGFIVATVLARSVREAWRQRRVPWSPLAGYLWRAWRRGRRARFLAPLVLEDLLPLPLPQVRALLAIEPLERPFAPGTLPPIAAPAPT
jgi:ubiquinone biosynthesis protein COQ4